MTKAHFMDHKLES